MKADPNWLRHGIWRIELPPEDRPEPSHVSVAEDVGQKPCTDSLCGHPQGWHVRGEGSCLECGCAAFSTEDATRPTPERPLMPSVPAGEGFFAAEGDERCGRVHVAARARCLMPKGHTGNHANTQGYWLDSEAADGWPEHVEADCDGLNADGTCPHGFGRTCCATRPTGDKE